MFSLIKRFLHWVIIGDADATVIARGCTVLVIGFFIFFYIKSLVIGMILCGVLLIVIGGLKKIYE